MVVFDDIAIQSLISLGGKKASRSILLVVVLFGEMQGCLG